ncbi:hypothetical protein ACEQPO_12780 [Bacillus sp. SL00103]
MYRLKQKVKRWRNKEIAVDAMRGDHAPKAIIDGVQKSLTAFSDIELHLSAMKIKSNHT